ncbi:ABC transporter, ATP-binding protein, partial [Clostridiales bacterium oral taxon 876 str. F0540]
AEISPKVLASNTFEVNDGLVGVLGPNGAGKTTAMKLITTLFSIQEGDVFLNGLDYKKDLKEVRKNIGYLPQNFSTYGHLKGREFLEIIGDLKLNENNKGVRRHIDEIIDKLNMGEYIDRKVKEYSGGMMQKLGFAQVLIGDPKLIVVDEPTVGLDPEQRNIIRELFPVISKDRIVLATTHIVEDIEYYCNYLLVIKKGQLIYKGTKENFIKEIEGMLWEDSVDSDTMKKIKETNEVIRTIENGGKYLIRYIGTEPVTSSSVEAKANLQDAYIVHSNMKGN